MNSVSRVAKRSRQELLKNPQTGNPLKVPYVASDERQVVVECRGRDEGIKIGNESSGPAELSPDTRKPLHDGIGERNQREVGQIGPELCQPRLWIGRLERPFEYLAIRHDADGQALMAQARHHIKRRRPASQTVDQDIRIDEITHGRSGGLEPSSRPR